MYIKISFTALAYQKMLVDVKKTVVSSVKLLCDIDTAMTQKLEKYNSVLRRKLNNLCTDLVPRFTCNILQDAELLYDKLQLPSVP